MIENKGEGKEVRYIVRIAGRDLNGKLPMPRALTKIRGISDRMAKLISIAFENTTGISHETALGSVPEEKDKIIEDIILNPKKYSLPAWALNRRRDFESGEDSHAVMGDLEFSNRKDIMRLSEIKSYRGLRHGWKLTVRGQRTRSTHRGKGPAVGVIKKEAKKGGSSGGK